MYPVVKKHIPCPRLPALFSLSSCRKLPYLSFTCLACVRDAGLAESNGLSDTPRAYTCDRSGPPCPAQPWHLWGQGYWFSNRACWGLSLPVSNLHTLDPWVPPPEIGNSVQCFLETLGIGKCVYNTVVHSIAFCGPQQCVAGVFTVLKVSRGESSWDSWTD